MVEDYESEVGIVKVTKVGKKDVRVIRVLILSGLLLMALFLWWFMRPEHIGNKLIFWLLTSALMFKLMKMLHEWYHYWSPSIPVSPLLTKQYTVDILTTACPGEPREMIVRTLEAMQRIRYPHTSYLCDEGNDPYLREKCRELGVVHVTRIDKTDAKAGNINNALKQAQGEIAVVLDPDHVPVPEFLDRTLPYFSDPEVGFVQCVQGYSNHSESFIARGAAEQTYHFYGPMMMCMNSYGTVQAIGANCTFRRSALDSIGGHAAGLAEDMHTAMQLHARGWKSVYIPEMLSRGLVPATLSSYYKQQLKWSRGTFDLLFRVYPKLFARYTWRQKLHYFFIPLYFLFGLVNFIDILVPVLALIFAEVPWEIDLGEFGILFLPLCGLSLLIRLFAQRWLLEPHERGLQLAGGILRTGTWWIFLLGFVYAIFNIQVPYIPTPKGDEHENYWKLSLPNLVIAAFICLAVWYGLSIDWSPYSLAMAFYAVLSASIFFFVVVMSQQRLLDGVILRLKRDRLFARLSDWYQKVVTSHDVLLTFARNGAVAISLASALLFLSYDTITPEAPQTIPGVQKVDGGFYFGADPSLLKSGSDVSLPDASAISLEREFGETIQPVTRKDLIPFLKWKISCDADSVCQRISGRRKDAYLRRTAAELRQYGGPVFLSFANELDPKDCSGEDFVKAWQYLVTFFNDLGISNITWVWQIEGSPPTFYPGEKFVDWVAVSVLNYGSGKNDSDHYSFTEIYSASRSSLLAFGKPVMISEFGCQTGDDQSDWYQAAFESLKGNFREVNGLLVFSGRKELDHWEADFALNAQTRSLFARDERREFFRESFKLLPVTTESHTPYRSAFVSGKPGQFRLRVKDDDVYIRGIAYNTAHDWRDGNMPLTRRRVEKDLQQIKEMGANTIRRYDHSIYDRNVLNIAEEKDLNVIYGFWFDPAVDYYSDSDQVEKYMKEMETQVMKYRDHPAILCWSLGNETWGLLKHNYRKPYLTLVRNAYLGMIEKMAKRLHELDPDHPVISCMEHEKYQLPGELVAFRDHVPSLDMIGVNSYYEEQISRVNHLFYQFDSLRPYIISEFGPRGYWDPDFNVTQKGLLIEQKESEKADWYVKQWKDHIAAYNGYNVGGVLYCWHDRMEGSNTWFGLSDYRGRLKRSYYAMKELWSGNGEAVLPEFRIRVPGALKAGSTYAVEASPVGMNVDGLKYAWQLNKDDYLESMGGLEFDPRKPRCIVRIPETPSDYRLYLYASDEKGNVSTASLAIKVK